ncbi:hypothetical protein D3C72_1137720 [compost metagenome]
MVVKFGVAGERIARAAIRHDCRRGVDLPHFHAVAIELIVLQRHRLLQRAAAFTAALGIAEQLVDVPPAVGLALPRFETQRLRDRQHVAH